MRVVITAIVLAGLCGIFALRAESTCRQCQEQRQACAKNYSAKVCKSEFDICMKSCKKIALGRGWPGQKYCLFGRRGGSDGRRPSGGDQYLTINVAASGSTVARPIFAWRWQRSGQADFGDRLAVDPCLAQADVQREGRFVRPRSTTEP
jgi:hypothetical protein